MATDPFLSICIPAYNRPVWLKRSLESITSQTSISADGIEIVISDDSTDPACREIAEQTLQQWSGQWRYVRNSPRLGMAQNWNQALQLASGDYVILLHDDDFLLENAVETIQRVIQRWRETYPVLLFGVRVVNEHEKILKQQSVQAAVYLPPEAALKQLLSNSSFVRFPAIAFQRQILTSSGYFDPAMGGVADLEMWVRLFSQYGVFYCPAITCAYTVHSQALTMDMFNQQTVEQLLTLFQQVEQQQLLNPTDLQTCQALFFHQFILAGTFRFLRRGKLDQVVRVMNLFHLQPIASLKPPLKWRPLRKLFELFAAFYQLTTGK
jgi:hypothetical protein